MEYLAQHLKEIKGRSRPPTFFSTHKNLGGRILKVKELEQAIAELVCTQGPEMGKPFRLLPWEKRFLKEVLKKENSVLALSLPRGNGKTAFIAVICYLAFMGDLFGHSAGEIMLVGPTLSQAKISFDHIKRLNPKNNFSDRKRYSLSDTVNRCFIEDRISGQKMQAFGGNKPKTLHGRAPILILIDEPAQFESKGEESFEVLKTAAGKHENCKVILIGTQAENDHHWYSKILDGGADYSMVYGSSVGGRPFTMREVAKANPSLKYFPHLKEVIRKEMAQAKTTPEKEASFRNLRLNQRTPLTTKDRVLSVEQYKKFMMASELPPREGEMVLGIDLGGSCAMSDVAAYWPTSGRLKVFGFFSSLPDLKKRGEKDHVGGLYLKFHDRGEIGLSGGHTTNVAEILDWVVQNWGNPSLIACDRFRKAELLDWLDRSSISYDAIHFRGMGRHDGDEDLKSFKRAVFEGRVKIKRSLLFETVMAHAVVKTHASGAQEICKMNESDRRVRLRDDVLVATVQAVALGHRERDNLRGGEMKVTYL